MEVVEVFHVANDAALQQLSAILDGIGSIPGEAHHHQPVDEFFARKHGGKVLQSPSVITRNM